MVCVADGTDLAAAEARAGPDQRPGHGRHPPRRRRLRPGARGGRRARRAHPDAGGLGDRPTRSRPIGHPVLRQPATRPVTLDELRLDRRSQSLIDDLVDTMRDANGAGLAANQVHESVRIAVIEVDAQPALPVQAADPAHRGRQPGARRRSTTSWSRSTRAACRCPTCAATCARHVNVRVQYLDRDGAPHDEVKRGLTAGTFQHECDHLDGRALRRPGDRPDDAHDLGAVRALPPRRLRRAHHRLRRAGGFVSPSPTTYWCEQAWLGGRVGRRRRAGRRRRRSHRGDGHRRDRPAAGRPPARRPHAARLRQRAQPRASTAPCAVGPTAGRGSFWTWRRQMYDLAATLDPDRYHRLARATFAEMALAGFTVRRASSTTSTTTSTARRYADPNVMGDALVAAAAEAGVRITLLDACYLHGGIGRDLEPEQRRFGDGSVDAWIERVDRRRPADHLRLGAAVHSVRACAPDEIEASQRGRRRPAGTADRRPTDRPGRRCTPTSASSRPRTTPASRPTDEPRRPSSATRARSARSSPPSTPPMSPTTTSPCSVRRRRRAVCARRPSATWPTAIGPAGRLAAAGIAAGRRERLAGGHRRAGGGPRRSSSTSAWRHASAGHWRPRRSWWPLTADGHRALGWDDAGRLEPGARADLVTVSLESVRLAGADPEQVLRAVVFAGTAADVTHVTVDGVDVVDEGRHCRLDVHRELADAITAAWA